MLAQARRVGLPPVVVAAGVNLVLVAVLALRPSIGLLFVGLAIVVPGVLVLVRRPQLGILVLVAGAPFNGLLLIVPHSGVVSAWKEALVVLSLGATFICPASARARPGRARPLTVLPAVIGLFLAALVAAAAVDPIRAAVGIKITFFYFLAGWTVWRCPLSDRERDRLITILMVTGVIQAALGILEQLAGPVRLNQIGFPYNSTIRFAGSFFRSFGTFIQPFGLGFYVMAVLLICTPVALSDPSRRRNRWFLLALPLLTLGMVTSVVRGAVLGLAIGIAYLGAHRYRILLLAIPLGVVAVLILPPEVANAALSSTSSQERVTGWQQNLKVITAHAFGAGPGSSSAGAEKLNTISHSTAATYQPDNNFYTFAYEDGMLGLWFFCLLLATAFLTARQISRSAHGPPAAFAAGVSAFFLAAAGASLVATFFEIFPMDVMFCVLLAAVISLPDQPDPTADNLPEAWAGYGRS
jgi:hypothetical protein